MKKSQWFILSAGSFFTAGYFFLTWSLAGPCHKLIELSDIYIPCIVKHSVYGSVFQIAFIFAFSFLICGFIESIAEKRR